MESQTDDARIGRDRNNGSCEPSASGRSFQDARSDPRAASAAPRWVRGRQLGSGSFGKVSVGVDSSSGRVFAVKSVEVQHESTSPSVELQALENEIEILSSIDSPHIIGCHGHSWTREASPSESSEGSLLRTFRNLHLELAPAGSVAGLLKDTGAQGLPLDLLRRYTRDITLALDYLHSRGIVHGDVKGLNALVTEQGAKLADFGTAWKVGDSRSENYVDQGRTLSLKLRCASQAAQGGGCASAGRLDLGGQQEPAPDNTCTTAAAALAGAQQRRELRGSPFWMSPETVMEEAGQGPPVDIWSLGCTVLEMATGKAPWRELKGQGLCAVLFTIGCTQALPQLPQALDPLARDFITCCLCRDQERRWCARALLQHPFLAGLDNAPQVHRACMAAAEQPCVAVVAPSVDVQQPGMAGRRGFFCESNAGSEELRKSGAALAGPRRWSVSSSAVSLCRRLRTAITASRDQSQRSRVIGALTAPAAEAAAAAAATPGLLTSRKRGLSPLGCKALENGHAFTSDCPNSPSADTTSPTSETNPRKKRREDDETLSSSFPLLELSLLADKSPAGLRKGQQATTGKSPVWPDSPLSQQGGAWIVVHSPKTRP